jgi:hypothetical protein
MGNLLERFLVRSLDLYGVGLFWSSIPATVLTVIIVIAIFWSPIRSLFGKVRGGKPAVEGQA